MSNCMPRNRYTCRGSIYITVMGVSMMVAIIGVSAILAARVQARAGTALNDFAEARICARSGIELAMLTIYNDSYWRTHFGNGAWYTNRSVGDGSFSISAVDPVDGDVTNGENDPVILTSTGTKGRAKYSTSMRMEVSPRVGSCLEVSMCSAGDLNITGATLTSNQTISSNTKVAAGSSAVVNANVEACSEIRGSGYTKTTKVTRLRRTMPDSQRVFDYYISNGTQIPYTSLMLFKTTQLISNTTFETDISGWYAVGSCRLKTDTSIVKQGLASLYVTNRKSTTDVAATDLPLNSMIKGHLYSVQFPVYSLALATMSVKLTLTTSTGTFTFSSPVTSVNMGVWTTLKTPVDSPLAPTWNGTLTKATVTVESNSTNKYYIDAVSFADVTFPDKVYVLNGQLLTPTLNPFGASGNPHGIYVLMCGGKNVIVSNSRIIGTLVMINAGSGSSITNSVVIEPAVINFPVFLTDSQVCISVSSSVLSEDTLGVNFNPPNAPYPYSAGTGTYTNSTCTDSYAASLNGLVYSKTDMKFDTGTTVNGVVVGAGKIEVSATSLNLNYNNIYLNQPPPGFTAGTIVMTPVPGTWQRPISP